MKWFNLFIFQIICYWSIKIYIDSLGRFLNLVNVINSIVFNVVIESFGFPTV